MTRAVVVGGLFLLAAVFLAAGRYAAFPVAPGHAFLLDRITGRAWVCELDACRPVRPEGTPRFPGEGTPANTAKGQ